MTSEIFGGAEPDPWSLPTPKHTWTTDSSDAPDDNDTHASAKTLQTSGDYEDTHNQTKTSAVDASSDDDLHKSIWEENPILSEPLQPNSLDTPAIEDPANNEHGTELFSWSAAIRKSFNPLSRDIIKISEIPEKEGLLFKHTNYLVTHLVPLNDADANADRKVVRRYSDFVWLLEVLLKKYPFRLIPELPPKKITSNKDPLFLERRRRGLVRFVNQIMRHPVLSQESLVIMFLTVPTDLTAWRRQANYDATEEYKDKKISQKFLKLWDVSLKSQWENAENIVKDALDRWNRLSILIERVEKRAQLIAQDNEKFQLALSDFRDLTTNIYSVENSNIGEINEGLKQVEKHIDTSKNLINDETQNIEDGISQDFKSYGDYLNSLSALFERFDRLGGNQVLQLKRKVELNQSKLDELNGKPDARGIDVDRHTEAIKRDEKEIAVQTNRDWLIKETVLSEFVLFQETQYQITKIFQDWASDKLKYSELHANNWTKLINILHDLPISASQ